MTPEEQRLVLALAGVAHGKPMPSDEFLQAFGADDGQKLGLELVCNAVARQHRTDLALALVVCFSFGFTDAHFESLEELAFSDWHYRHEDVASALGELRLPRSVAALTHLATWMPNFVGFGENDRALAIKALTGLGRLDASEACEALESFCNDSDPIVAEGARYQLEKQRAQNS